MDAFAVFKIIMGIIISVFIIIMVYNFATSYMGVNETKKQASIYRELERVVRDVHVNGIPNNFSMNEDAYAGITMYRPPFIVTKAGNIDFGYIPLFFESGRTISITRATNDLGWWKFDYVMAIPKTKIVFIPLKNTDMIWNELKSISSAFPDTENIEPDVTFGLGCTNEEYYKLDKWKRKAFVSYIFNEYLQEIKALIDYGRLCDIFLEKDEYPIYISEDETELDEIERGIFVVPEFYGGKAYLKEEGFVQVYNYTDGLDIAALIIGGEALYNYKNKIYLTQVRVAAKLKSDELRLLEKFTKNADCKAAYPELESVLDEIQGFSDDELKRESGMALFISKVISSKETHSKLEVLGCV